jgi:hypothetical protein
MGASRSQSIRALIDCDVKRADTWEDDACKTAASSGAMQVLFVAFASVDWVLCGFGESMKVDGLGAAR